ncbi:MAG: hypothetical protein HY961_11660 [Ignavibacteriae bacterium]|nr:hypothetical protein [Ignavibacteriota bacterium]
MTISAGKHTITLDESAERGMTWVVRLYRKGFLFKKKISSDWFLDKEQARGFAEQLAEEVRRNSSDEEIAKRKPGWTLHAPPR